MSDQQPPEGPRQEFTVVGGILTILLLTTVLPLAFWLISLLWGALTSS